MNDNSYDNERTSVNEGLKSRWRSYTDSGYERLEMGGFVNAADARYLRHQWHTSCNERPARLKDLTLRFLSFADEEAANTFVDFMVENQAEKLCLFGCDFAMHISGVTINILCGRLNHLECLHLQSMALVGTSKGRDIRELLRSSVGCIKEFVVHFCTLDWESCTEITEGLKECCSGLQKVHVKSPMGVGAAEFRLFADGLVNSPSVLSLKEVTLTQFTRWDVTQENSTFPSLARVLKSCHQLEILEVSWCNTFKEIKPNDPDYLEFIQSFRSHKFLKCLEIKDFRITDSQSAPLYQALQDGPCSLKSLVLESVIEAMAISLMANLPKWKTLERLTVKVDWNSPELLHALRQNTSLIEIGDLQPQNAESIQPILRRNKTILKTLPKLLANQSNSTATNWPLCVQRLREDSDDMTPVFLLPRQPWDLSWKDSSEAEGGRSVKSRVKTPLHIWLRQEWMKGGTMPVPLPCTAPFYEL